MTQTKAAAAVLAAINDNTSESFESVVGIAIEAAARALLKTTFDKEKLVLHCFLMLSHELQGRPVSDVSREVLAEDCPGLELVETREALKEQAWEGKIPPGIQQLAEAVTGDHLPVAWCSSIDLEEAQAKRQSFCGWREPHNDCDMALYAGPAPALPLPVTCYDAGEGVTIEAASHQRTRWAVRCSGGCLNKRLTWEPEPTPSDRDYDFLARCRWPSAEEAYAALHASRSTTTEP